MRLDLSTLLILSLAAYRLTRFFIHDSLLGGSPDSGSRWSAILDGFAYKESGENRSWIRGKIGDLFTCHFCLSFWICLALYGLLVGRPLEGYGWGDGLAVWAMAGAVSLTYEFLGREHVTNVIVPKR